MDSYGVGALGGVVLVDPATGLPYRATGGGGGARKEISLESASGDTSADVEAEGFHLINIAASAPTRVRGYRSAQDRSDDSPRPAGESPLVQGVVLFDFVFDSPATYWSTGYKCFLPEGSTALYLAVSDTADISLEIEV